jgi:ribulose kinase
LFDFASLQFQELGLLPRTPVGTSILDAYAGGVGVMESVPNAEFKADSKCCFPSVSPKETNYV